MMNTTQVNLHHNGFSLTDIIDSIHTIFQAFLKDAEQYIHSDGNNDTNYSTDQT